MTLKPFSIIHNIFITNAQIEKFDLAVILINQSLNLFC
jgi:hypothetical protein